MPPTRTPTRNASIGLIVLLLSLLATPVSTQQGVVSGDVYGQWFTSAGAVCNACKLYFYAAGTSTPQDTYTSAALTTANDNPVVLSSAGRALIFLSDKSYKVVLKTSADVEIWTADNVVGRAPPANVLSKTANYTVAVTDGKDVLVQTDASGGAITITLYTAVGNTGRIVRVMKTDSSTNAVTVDGNASETINGATTYSVTADDQVVTLMSNGSNWVITAVASLLQTWTAVSFSAGSFTANGAMTWTVESADQVTYSYTKSGTVMTLAWTINGTTVGGTPNTALQIAIPGGFTASKTMHGTMNYHDNGTPGVGHCSAAASATFLQCFKTDASNWTAATNATNVRGQITFETTT